MAADMPYYQEEHETAYRRIGQLGYTQWNDLFDQNQQWTFDRFQNRGFLEGIIPELDLPQAAEVSVFEYGCGTGPAACFLAARGFQVEAIDLIPEAIAIAERMANARNLQIAFSVGDICALADQPSTTQYNLVLDSYVLQSIVTDQDRRAVFAAVRARLKPHGYYVVSTALRDPGRADGPGFFYDTSSGMYHREVPVGSVTGQVVKIDGRWYVPCRRHLSADALRDELAAEGFDVLNLNGPDPGDVVCRLRLKPAGEPRHDTMAGPETMGPPQPLSQ